MIVHRAAIAALIEATVIAAGAGAEAVGARVVSVTPTGMPGEK